MLELGRSHGPTFELNGTLVTEAQAALASMNMADRAYALIKSSAYAAGLSDYYVAAQSGADAALVFETRDGSDLDQMKIPGLYSYAGFHEFFFKQLGAVAAKLESEHWVMGDAGKQSGVESQFERLGPELLDRYSRDFIASWEGALDNLKLRSITQDKPDYQVLAALSSEATSPLRQLLESIKAETALTQERDEPAPPRTPTAAPSAADDAAKKIALQVPDPTGGLARIGIKLALKKSQVRAGEVNGGASAAAANPGSNIEAYFKPYHNWVEGDQGSRPIDVLLHNAQRRAREPAGGRQLSVAVGPGQREAALAGGQSARHRLAPAKAVCPHDLRDRRGIRRRGGRQLEGADERRARPTSPNSASAWWRTNIRLRATPPAMRRSASSHSCSARTACWTSSSPTISRRSPT